MINKVILVGNLGADPETRTAQSGSVVANIRLATAERRKASDGTWTDHTEWHRVVCFGKTAENVSKFLKKGRQVYVEGTLRTNKYQDKDGKDRFSTDVIANEIRFLGAGGGTAGSENSASAIPSGRSAKNEELDYENTNTNSTNFDDDIPF